MRLELTCTRHQILSLARLPIQPIRHNGFSRNWITKNQPTSTLECLGSFLKSLDDSADYPKFSCHYFKSCELTTSQFGQYGWFPTVQNTVFRCYSVSHGAGRWIRTICLSIISRVRIPLMLRQHIYSSLRVATVFLNILLDQHTVCTITLPRVCLSHRINYICIFYDRFLTTF